MWKVRGAVLTCGAALLFAHAMANPAQHPDSLRFTVVVPGAVRRGEPVPITLRLTNASSRPVDVYLTGRSVTFDIIVARPGGQIVWRRLEHVSGQQILQIKMLAPHETVELKDVWKGATDPGEYTVQGVLPTDGEPLKTTAVRLRVTSS